MQNLLAYTLAAIVVGILTLTVFGIRKSGSETSVSAVQFRASKEQSLDVAAMIQRDFTNIGSNHPNYDLPLDSVFVTIDTVGSEQSFSFRGQTTRGSAPSLITYEWVQTGTTYLDSTDVPVYQLTRYIDGVNSGGSTAGIVEFRLSFQRENGTVVTNPKSARQIQVDMRSVSTIGANDLSSGTRWSAIIRPTALQIE